MSSIYNLSNNHKNHILRVCVRRKCRSVSGEDNWRRNYVQDEVGIASASGVATTERSPGPRSLHINTSSLHVLLPSSLTLSLHLTLDLPRRLLPSASLIIGYTLSIVNLSILGSCEIMRERERERSYISMGDWYVA